MAEEQIIEQTFTDAPRQEDPLKKLYNGLKSDGKYTKSFDEFKSKYSTQESVDMLYNGLFEDKDYTKTKDDFYSQYFPSVKKKENGISSLPSSSVGLSQEVKPIEYSPEDIYKTVQERKFNEKELAAVRKMNVQKTAAPGYVPQLHTDLGEKELANIEIAKRKLGEQGIDESVYNDLKEISPSYMPDFKGLVKLKKENPISYNRLVSSYKWQSNLFDKIKEEESPEKAAEIISEIKKMQGSDLSPEQHIKKGELIRDYIYRYSHDATEQNKLLNDAAKDIVGGYAAALIYGGNDFTKTMEGTDLNKFQKLGLAYIKAFEPQKYSQTKRLLEAKPTSSEDTKFQLGDQKNKKQLEDIGLGIVESAISEKIRNYELKVDSGEKLSKQEMEDYSLLANQYEVVQAQRDVQKRNYPRAYILEVDDLVKEATQENKNSVGKEFALKTGKQVDNVMKFIRNVAQSPFLSENEKAVRDIRDLGDYTLFNSMTYRPESQRIMASDVVAEFPEDVQNALDLIDKDNSLTKEQKESKQFEVISKNKDKIRFVTNDKSGKVNITGQTLLRTISDTAAQLLPQIALTYMTGGASNITKAREIKSLFASTFATTYQSYYEEALDKKISDPFAYALVNTTIEASTELINPDLSMMKRLYGVDTPVGKILNSISEKEWDAIKSAKRGRFSQALSNLSESIKPVFKEASKETFLEEVPGQIAQNIANNKLFGEDNGLTEGVDETIINTFIGMWGTSLAGIPFNYKKANWSQKQLLYNAGLNADKYIIDIDKQLSEGNITPTEAAENKELLKKMGDIIQSTDFVKDNGKLMTDNEKTQYAYNLLTKQQLSEKAKNASEKRKENIKEEIAEVDKDNDKILSGQFPKNKPNEETKQPTYDDIAKEFNITEKDPSSPFWEPSEKSAKDVMSWLAESDFTLPHEKELIKQYNKVIDPELKIVFDTSMPMNRGGAAVFRSGKLVRIDINPKVTTIKNSTSNFQQVVLHEITHALTYQDGRMSKDLAEKLAPLFDVADEYISKNINSLKQIFNEHKITYGVSAINEFAAEAMSNRDFQKILASIPYKNTSKSVWDKFLDSIKQYFSKLLGTNNETLLNEVVNVISIDVSDINQVYEKSESTSNNGIKFPIPTKDVTDMTASELEKYHEDVRKYQKETKLTPEQEENLSKEEADAYYGKNLPEGGVYDPTEIQRIANRVSLIEEYDNAEDIANTIKRPLIDYERKNDKENLAVIKAAKRRIDELGISPQEFIDTVKSKLAGELKEPSLVDSIFESIKDENKSSIVIQKAIDEGKLTGIYADLIKQGNEQEVLKEISQQAQNLNPDGTPKNDGLEEKSMKATREQFGDDVVDMAIEKFPQEQSQKSSISVIRPEKNKQPNIIEKSEVKENIPPPSEPTVEVEEEFKGGKKKSLLNRLVDTEKIPAEAREMMKSEGLEYEPKSQIEAQKIAESILDEEGLDNAVLMAQGQKFGGDVNTLIQTEALNRLSNLEEKAITPAEKLQYAQKFAEVSIALDKWAREKAGRGVAALDYFYKKSPLGIVLTENIKRKEDFENWSKPKDKSWKEAWEELMKEPEFENIVNEKVQEGLKKERASAREKRIQKVRGAFKAAKDKFKKGGGGTYATIIPPHIMETVLEAMELAYEAGEAVGKIITDAIDSISQKLGHDNWDKDKFRKEWEETLKDTSQKKKTFTDEELKAKVLDKFRKKLKGLSEEEKDEVVRRAFKQIVQNDGLNYEEFKSIIASVTGRAEITPEDAQKIKELVAKTNLVEEASKRVREERTQQSLDDLRKAQYEAGKAGRELSEILWNKPDIIKRLTGIMQLNTLGIPSLVNNPIYNIFNQIFVRFPVVGINAGIDSAMTASAKVMGKKYQRQYSIGPAAQIEFFKKLGVGLSESIEQLRTGLNRQDYINKEIYGQQIRPFKAARDLIQFFKGNKKLTQRQVIDKSLQATVGVPAEVVARVLNIGDKPQRFGAEGAQASVFAKELGLKDIDYKIFTEFPREEAYRIYKEKGLSDADAAKKADFIKEAIIKEGQRSTFQQDNLLNDFITRAFSVFGGKDSGWANLAKTLTVSPYIKIPSNAFWSYYNLINPEIALLQSFVHGGISFSKRNSDSVKSQLQLRESRYWLGHAIAGMALRGVVIMLVKQGVFVPASDADDTKKEREGKSFFESQGTINISKLAAALRGDDPSKLDHGILVSNRWFGQFGTIGNAIAKKDEDLTPEQREKQIELWDVMFGGMEKDALQDVQTGVFSNTSAIIASLGSGSYGGKRYVQNTVGLFTNIVHPGTLSQISRAQLPYYSTTKADTFLGEIKNSMLQRSSVLRKISGQYPPSKLNIWGEVMVREGNTIEKLFGISESNKDNFAQPIYEDVKKTGDIGFFPPSVYFNPGNGKKLTTEEQRTLEHYVGESRKSYVAPYINDMAVIEGFEKTYSQIEDPEDRKRILTYLYELGRIEGIKKFVQDYPQYDKKANEITEEIEKEIKDIPYEIFKDIQKIKSLGK